MNDRNEQRGSQGPQVRGGVPHLSSFSISPVGTESYTSCALDEEAHCATCSDEALPAQVLRVDQEAGLALVMLKGTTEEIDITLVEHVVPGDMLLVHGGVAIGKAND